MSAIISHEGYDYAMIMPGDPDIEKFVGYREGMEISSDGTITSAGTYVPGSNNGWVLRGSVGAASIYMRVTPPK